MSAERSCMIIDSHPVVRLGMRRLLEPSFVVEELADGSSACELLTNVGRFDVAVIEMCAAARGGGPSGVNTIRELLQLQPGMGIVAHGDRVERHAVRQAFDAGASGYVSRRSPPGRLLKAVEAAAEQEAFVDPAAGPQDARPAITRRQREVLQLFADGLSTPEVAGRLEVSEETVRTHAKASLGRLGARDRTHAVAIALRGSLID